MSLLGELMDQMPALAASELQAQIAAHPELVHARSELGNTLLHEACWHKRADLARVLIDAGADVNARGDHGRTPLHCAVHDAPSDRMLPVVRVLVDAHAVAELEDAHGFTVEECFQREVWDAAGDVLATLGIAASYKLGVDDYETAREIDRLLRTFRDAKTLPDDVPQGADARCIRDLRLVLAHLAGTTWAEPIRIWLRTTYKAAYANRLVGLYARGDLSS